MNIPFTRCDGWTSDRRDIFIAELTAGRGVTRAAAAAGPSASSVYRLYRRDASFAARWDAVSAARVAAMRATPLPSRQNASTAQIIGWLKTGKRRGFTQFASGRDTDIDVEFAAFMNFGENSSANP